MAAIATQQIRKIYAIGNALGIVERGNAEDSLHDLVSSITGKDSLKALTYAEAQAVIRDLEKQLSRTKRTAWSPSSMPPDGGCWWRGT